MSRFLVFFALGLIVSCSVFANEKVEYEVLNIKAFANEKISVDVVISCPIEEARLSHTARIIHKTLKGIRFKRVFMAWYLPGMKIDAGSWNIILLKNFYTSNNR